MSKLTLLAVAVQSIVLPSAGNVAETSRQQGQPPPTSSPNFKIEHGFIGTQRF